MGKIGFIAALFILTGCNGNITEKFSLPTFGGSGSTNPTTSPTPASTSTPAPTATPGVSPTPSVPPSSYHYLSPTGSDLLGDGTQSNPWKSLYKATASVTASGHVIKLAAGTYVETSSSNLALGVSIEGNGSDSVIKSTLTAQWTPIIIAVSPEGSNGNQSISKIKLDGSGLTTSVAIVVAGRSNVSIHDITVVDFRDVGVSFSGIQGWTGYLPPSIYAVGNSFYNNVVTNCSTYIGYGTGNVQFGGQKGFLFHHNTISQPSRGNGGKGIGWPLKMANEGYIKGCKIFNNTLTKAPFTGAYNGDDGWNFAVEFWNIEGLEIFNNNIQGNVDLSSVTKGAYDYGLYIHDNTFSAPAVSSFFEEGIFLETDQYDVTIEKNTFRNLAAGIGFAPHDYTGQNTGINVHRIKIRNNLFENIGIVSGGRGSAIQWHNTDYNPITHVSDVFIDNNTIVAAPGANAALIGFGLPGYQNSSASNIYARNNIVKGFSYTPIHALGTALSTVWLQNNLHYQNGNNNDPLFASGPPTSLTTQSILKLDPMFVSSSDFHLQATSPALNAGINVGLPYNGSAPDLGAFER